MEGSSKIPVVVLGLGPIGLAVIRCLAEEPELQLVAAVDPARAGERLDALVDLAGPGLVVEADPGRGLALARGGVAVHAVCSSFEGALPDLERAVRAGVSVVSTCEELAFPWLRHEQEAERLDAACAKAEVAVVGLGVNPGFAMDRLPALLSQVTGPVRHVSCVRIQDVTLGRPGVQRKAGLGLDEEAFQEAVDAGEIGQAGLSESAMLAALGCGFELDEVEEELSPLIAEEEATGPVPLRIGQVAGVQQVARGFVDGEERVRLELVLALDADDPHDAITLEARPPIRARIEGGVPGDEGTAWSVVHAAVALVNLRGLVTSLDLPSGR